MSGGQKVLGLLLISYFLYLSWNTGVVNNYDNQTSTVIYTSQSQVPKNPVTLIESGIGLIMAVAFALSFRSMLKELPEIIDVRVINGIVREYYEGEKAGRREEDGTQIPPNPIYIGTEPQIITTRVKTIYDLDGNEKTNKYVCVLQLHGQGEKLTDFRVIELDRRIGTIIGDSEASDDTIEDLKKSSILDQTWLAPTSFEAERTSNILRGKKVAVRIPPEED